MEYGAWVGLWTFIGMFAFLMLGVPIFICLFAAAFVGSWLIGGPIYTLQQFASALTISRPHTSCRCPLVHFDVHIGGNCGIAQSSYDAARKWLGSSGDFNCYRGAAVCSGRMRLKHRYLLSKMALLNQEI
jgi:hypothetical protein